MKVEKGNNVKVHYTGTLEDVKNLTVHINVEKPLILQLELDK